MSKSSDSNPFGFSDLLQLHDVMSDFSIAEIALRENDSVILADQGSWKYVLMTMNEYERYLRFKAEEEDRSVQKQLPVIINGIGKRFFVDYYVQLKLLEGKKDPQFEADLATRNNWSKASLDSRISRSFTIFKNGWEIDALRHIIDSPNSDTETRDRAQLVLNKELETIEGITKDTAFTFTNHTDWMSEKDNLIVLEKMNNKRFAFRCIDLLLENNALNGTDIEMLTDKDQCRSKFCCSGFPILSEVTLEGELTDKDYNQGGKQRFYKSKIIIRDRAFVLSNHWYGPDKSMPDNRTPFLAWVLDKIKS